MVVSPSYRSSIGDGRSILGAERAIPHSSIQETMKIDDVKVLLADDTAVVASIVVTYWNIGEQKLTIKMCHSDTYVKRAGRWQLLATHAAIVDSPADKPAAVNVDPRLFDAYAGVYQLGGILLKVYRKGDKLFMEGVAGTPFELIPESPDIFMMSGTPAKHIFVRDSNGKVTHLVTRARGQELRATKVQ
jgi:hypothetical protein